MPASKLSPPKKKGDKFDHNDVNSIYNANNNHADLIDKHSIALEGVPEGDSVYDIFNLKGAASNPADCIYITGGGSGPTGSDSEQFQSKVDQAIATGKKLVIPACDANKYYRLTNTLVIRPQSGKNECYLDIEAHGIPRSQIVYDGPVNTPCIQSIGHRFGIWTGIKIALANKVGLIAFDIDTEAGTPSIDSNTHNTYINCQVALGSLTNQNQKGWRIGYVSGGGADISDLSWINCSVFGKFGGEVNPNDYGWHIYGPNTLANTWTNGFGARLGKMFSNVSDVPNKTGNGACYFFGTSTSQNLLDFEIGNSQSYLISGGRFESGKQVLDIKNANISPAVTFQNVNIDDYEGAPTYGAMDGRCLFFMDMPASLSLDNCNIKAGRHESYDQNMIRAFGGGGALKGRILVRGGALEVDPTKEAFWTTGSEPEWIVSLSTVARIDPDGRPINMFKEDKLDLTVDRQIYLKEFNYLPDEQIKRPLYSSFKAYFARVFGFQPVNGKEVLFNFIKSSDQNITVYFPENTGNLTTTEETEQTFVKRNIFKYGYQNFNSGGTIKVFTIPHLLADRPDSVALTFQIPSYRNGDYSIELTSTSIIVTYVTSPPVANCLVYWQAYQNQI